MLKLIIFLILSCQLIPHGVEGFAPHSMIMSKRRVLMKKGRSVECYDGSPKSSSWPVFMSSLTTDVSGDEDINGKAHGDDDSSDVDINTEETANESSSSSPSASFSNSFVKKEFNVASSTEEDPRSDEETAKLAKEIISKVNPNRSPLTTSPPLTFQKYLSMQEKRVQVKIRYTETPGLRPYFLTVAKKIKMHNPDIIVEKVILPAIDDDTNLDDTVFEVIVDGKIVIGKSRTKWCNVRRSGKDEIDNNKMFGMSFYVSMEDVNVAIGKARKKKRPHTTVYPPEDRARSIGLEMLRSGDEEKKKRR